MPDKDCPFSKISVMHHPGRCQWQNKPKEFVKKATLPSAVATIKLDNSELPWLQLKNK